MVSNVTVTGKLISCSLAFYQPDLESRTFAWPIRPLHTHWWNIMSHNLVTEIRNKLTRSKIGTQSAFTRDRSSRLTNGYLFLRRCGSRHQIFIRIGFLYYNWLGMLYAGVKSYAFNRLRFLRWCQIGHQVRREIRSEFVWLWFLRSQPHLTTSWSRGHCRHLQLSPEDVNSLHKLSKCFRGWYGCIHVHLGFNNCRNLQFRSPIHHISPTEVDACVAQPGHVNSSSLIYFCRKLSMRWCTVFELLPIPQPRSSSLGLPSSVYSSSSSSSSPFCSSSEILKSLKLAPIAFYVSSDIVSGFLVVAPAFSAVLMSPCSGIIAVSASRTHFLATEVSLSTWSSIHFSFSSLLKKCISCLSSTESFVFDRKLRNAHHAWTHSASKPLLPSFA